MADHPADHATRDEAKELQLPASSFRQAQAGRRASRGSNGPSPEGLGDRCRHNPKTNLLYQLKGGVGDRQHRIVTSTSVTFANGNDRRHVIGPADLVAQPVPWQVGIQ